MATQLPPPKRQKSNYSKSIAPPTAPAPVIPIPSIVVQFKNAETGESLGPAINLAADTGRDALQMLVNKLKGDVSGLIKVELTGRTRTRCHTPSISSPSQPWTAPRQRA